MAPKNNYQGALKTDFVFITRPIFAQKVSNGAQWWGFRTVGHRQFGCFSVVKYLEFILLDFTVFFLYVLNVFAYKWSEILTFSFNQNFLNFHIFY